MNSRRKLLAAFAMGALMHGLPARAQKQDKAARPRRIGFIAVRARPASWDNDYYGELVRRLEELGHVEGKTVVFDWRFADGKVERLPQLAKELVESQPDVIVTSGTSATRAVQEATRTIPIVMAVSADAASSGFITYLARPGRNITGVTRAGIEVSPKYLELLVTAVPKLARVAVLLNPDNEFYSPRLKSIHAAARTAKVRVQRVEASTSGEIENSFKIMEHEEAQALIVPLDPVFVQNRDQLASLALKYKLPSVFGVREHVEAGGLMSYGQNFTQLYRRAAGYVDKILKGAKPAELPVSQPMAFEIAINMKTAAALGLRVPESLRVAASRIVR
jgi:putative ABC transport system substrate-binding protein